MCSPEEADTSSLLPATSETGNGNGVLRQGSKKLWRRLSREPTAGTNVGSRTDLEGEQEEDRTSNSGNYSLLNNLNNRQPR